MFKDGTEPVTYEGITYRIGDKVAFYNAWNVFQRQHEGVPGIIVGTRSAGVTIEYPSGRTASPALYNIYHCGVSTNKEAVHRLDREW